MQYSPIQNHCINLRKISSNHFVILFFAIFFLSTVCLFLFFDFSGGKKKVLFKCPQHLSGRNMKVE